MRMKYKYTITGIDCPGCAAKLTANMEKCEGVSSAKINFIAERLTVESELSETELRRTLEAVSRAFSSDIEIE